MQIMLRIHVILSSRKVWDRPRIKFMDCARKQLSVFDAHPPPRVTCTPSGHWSAHRSCDCRRRRSCNTAPRTGFTTPRISFGLGLEEETLSQAVMSIRQVSAASEADTLGLSAKETDVDHSAFIKPTLQTVCWLADLVLSTKGMVGPDVPKGPSLRQNHIVSTVKEVGWVIWSYWQPISRLSSH